MRYQVGQTYPFLRIKAVRGKDNWSSLFIPWLDIFESIEVIVPLCAEHHKVPTAYDNKPENDGFVFTLDDCVYHNQYPKASYGQLDDSNDRKLRREYGDTFTNADVEDHMRPYDDALAYLANIQREITRTKDSITGSVLPDNKKEMMVVLREHIIVEVEKATGKKVEFQPLVISFTDGRPPVTYGWMPVARLI